jgi:hypothetical protein
MLLVGVKKFNPPRSLWFWLPVPGRSRSEETSPAFRQGENLLSEMTPDRGQHHPLIPPCFRGSCVRVKKAFKFPEQEGPKGNGEDRPAKPDGDIGHFIRRDEPQRI